MRKLRLISMKLKMNAPKKLYSGIAIGRMFILNTISKKGKGGSGFCRIRVRRE